MQVTGAAVPPDPRPTVLPPPDPRPSVLRPALLDWYARSARDLPWREGRSTPWGVLVSEVMLQQTPVIRVLPVWEQWMDRWPTPADLAADSPGEAVRAWGRLGYPRRALRLHAAAAAIAAAGGEVPNTEEGLQALPGVGDYTAAAVATFAHGQRTTVLDTNIRRVLARILLGTAYPAPSVTRVERELATSLVPADGPTASRWSVAVMELGALVCTARAPRCEACPVRNQCSWYAAGRPEHEGPPRRGQAWEGTDRQVRGALLAVLRASPTEVKHRELVEQAGLADDARAAQVDRCLHSLITDGLLEPGDDGGFRLPH